MSSRSKRAAESFHTVQDAKDFLIGRILDQADRESAPVTGLERKMLAYSEGDASDDAALAAASEEFDRDYDMPAYEKKMAAIARRAYRHDWRNDTDDAHRWLAAIRRLKSEDHYLSVILLHADIRPPYDSLKLLFAGIAAAAGAAAIMPFLDRITNRVNSFDWSFGYSARVGRFAGVALVVLMVVGLLASGVPASFYTRRRPPISIPPAEDDAPSTEATYLEDAARESRRRYANALPFLVWIVVLFAMSEFTRFLAWSNGEKLLFLGWTFALAAIAASTLTDRTTR
jgi:hypothetical protein